MKLSIKKLPNRHEPTIEVEIATSTATAPVTFLLSESAWKSLSALVAAGLKADVFAVSIDL